MDQPPKSGQRLRASDRAPRELERLWRPVAMAVRRLVPVTDPEHDDLVRTALACVVAALAVRPAQAEYSEQWLVAVARNVAFDRVQQRTREQSIAQGDAVTGASPSPEKEPETELVTESVKHVRDRVRRLALGLGRVGQSNAVMVIQHDVLGKNLDEIASALGISVTVARSRLVRGRRALLEQLRRRAP